MESAVKNAFNCLINGGIYSADSFYENGEHIYYVDSYEDEKNRPECSYVAGENYKLSAHRALQGDRKTEEFEVIGTQIVWRDFMNNTTMCVDIDV
jgi:hypothetical protein